MLITNNIQTPYLPQGAAAIPKLHWKNQTEKVRRNHYTLWNTAQVLIDLGYLNKQDPLISLLNDDTEIPEATFLLCIEQEIEQKIANYLITPNNDLLKDIFHYTQLWVGSDGLNIYIKEEGFKINMDWDNYQKAVANARKGNVSEAIEGLKKLKHMGIESGTAHLYFWTNSLQGILNVGPRQLPVNRLLINYAVFGTYRTDWTIYKKYINELYDGLKQINSTASASISLNQLSAQLENYIQSVEGTYWIARRIMPLKEHRHSDEYQTQRAAGETK